MEMPPHVQKYPHGTPMVCSGTHPPTNRISIASFNLLAPLYIRPIDQRTGEIQPFAAFEWISDQDSERILGNEHRLPRLLQSMQKCESDFICVQELQLEREEEKFDCLQQVQQLTMGGKSSKSRKEECALDDNAALLPTSQFVLPKWITPLIQSSTSSDSSSLYNIILPPQKELGKIAERNRRVLLADVAITNAIFYRSDKWIPNEKCSASSSTTCVVQSFLPIDGERGNDIDSDPIVISSIHLDAQREEKRVQQLQRCLEQSIACS
eukprot:CAMPEP_0201921908 /NCGR_PEP_ID=MMETSP0903-20130614/10107_1 /ASSEMBLY_ACC=CAM_ASM_000552 /TAXON_ID=420261 /ORGANISM="Thalassiosira antarctica, Strain CCMP982" /LENGTH=266 /DNA_ID=CAMNT_0048458945 /DNA_START=153 /DNA_END=949 /DNA_ORIENTATION=-